ncbi:MAG: hypothetical protein AB1513_10325 [Pseudomonadota bacterium]
MKHAVLTALAAVLFSAACAAQAANEADIAQIREEIRTIKEDYEARIRALEQRLQRAEAAAPAAATAAPKQPADNAYNPPLALILSGTYANLSQDPAAYAITGYGRHNQPSQNRRGFGLTESELGLAGNIDPYFRATATIALAPDNSVDVENAFVQTTALGSGWGVTAGRFHSGIGYLNAQHKHAWDFVDEPLAYRALLGTQLGIDGVQASWLAPTDMFLQIGAEAGRGLNFLAPAADKNGSDLGVLFVAIGGDLDDSTSWLAGLSALHTAPKNQRWDETDLAGAAVTNAFSGTSKLWLADFVLKWAPNGNPTERNFKLQGEYLGLDESGTVFYDTVAANTPGAYSAKRDGWYMQGVYQFVRGWRAGLRHDRLNGGGVDYGVNNANLLRSGYNPTRTSIMLDYNPSEFSRIRLQLGRDQSRQGATDNQVFVQYMMSLGAHGAHRF